MRDGLQYVNTTPIWYVDLKRCCAVAKSGRRRVAERLTAGAPRTTVVPDPYSILYQGFSTF